MSALTLKTALDDTRDVFDLDVTLLEVTEAAGQIAATDDGCGSTCGACVSGSA